MKKLQCRTDPPYTIYVGPLNDGEIREALFALAREEEWASPAVIVSDNHVAPLYADRLQTLLTDAGLAPSLMTVEAGEGSKSMATFEVLCQSFLERGVCRRSPVFALGGGVVGDLAGFAAATFSRGMPWVVVPTSLLAQVDSSVGGKVAINLPVAKNMLGSFHQPRMVIADPNCLKTLPEREYLSGLAEILKSAIVGDRELLTLLEERGQAILDREVQLLEGVVDASLKVKCDVVERDEKDYGHRHVLNLGHTFGHAIEAVAGYGRWLHGEAVAVGLCAALWLSWRMGSLSEEAILRIENLLTQWGLPVRASGLDPAEVEKAMGYDKKFTRGRQRFVLIEDWGRPVIVPDPPRELVRETIRRMVSA
ncbi:MAG: 3-dehydroquinate synthase [Candidatus Eisenbacteria bacterium]|uniref:3-dehydroquinate synthase n=1 Tax=Eiseniibacteriota bacterium TaxID=2212470 RepID=A0A948RYK1_UNCEI|nr:3-dehydroquinate synthase [Candidatus Eisenbacteria bacterium]MBU1951209.1 3-dehydroquinate synthase [Candidatus Eisenbacteria bacterium]MBU2690604.1 3-dehydroquinate synthase [Candidatus Eisenbacteria bacterium]